MKRVLLLILALAMVLASVPCYATQVSSSEETAQSTVYCTIESSFCVVVPKNIDCFNSFQFTAESMNILDYQQVNIYLNGGTRIPVYNDAGESIEVEFFADGSSGATRFGSFTQGMLESPISVTCQPVFANSPKAGNYSGTVEFVVRLEDSIS